MDFDKDLQSIQEVRWLVAKAVVAQKELAKMSQQQVDGIAKAIADACAAQSERLAKMAVEETGFGIWQDKVLKNLLGSAITWDSVKDMKTVGIIKDDRQNGLMEVGVPMGVVAAFDPIHESDIHNDVQVDYFNQSGQCHCHQSASECQELYY